MKKYFISYSHADSPFVNEFILDLTASEIKATYDQWELKVGDSIINKISELIDTSIGVIPIISKNSITSNWVSKELSLAMTGEINEKGKVYPVKIDDSSLPPALKDKFYADLGTDYYSGLRRLLDSLQPPMDYFHGKVEPDPLRSDVKLYLNTLLNSGDESGLKEWFFKNSDQLLYEFGSRWATSEILEGLYLKNNRIHFLAINGQSYRYDITLIILGNLSIDDDQNYLDQMVEKIKALQSDFLNNENLIKRLIALKLKNSYGAEQLLSSHLLGFGGPSSSMFSFDPKVTLVAGRRAEYGKAFNDFRSLIFEKSNRTIEIASYNRIIDSITKGKITDREID